MKLIVKLDEIEMIQCKTLNAQYTESSNMLQYMFTTVMSKDGFKKNTCAEKRVDSIMSFSFP